jgi:hypothetical protein
VIAWFLRRSRDVTPSAVATSGAAATTRPSPATGAIASLRNVSWNLTVWPIHLRPPITIPPRAGASSIPLIG